MGYQTCELCGYNVLQLFRYGKNYICADCLHRIRSEEAGLDIDDDYTGGLDIDIQETYQDYEVFGKERWM